MSSESLYQKISNQRFISICGKGGVGRSTLTAALAKEAARNGKKTLVAEFNTTGDLGEKLGHDKLGHKVTQLEENLFGVNLLPSQCLKEYALMILKSKLIYKVVFENNLVRYFLRFMPGLSELVMLGKVYFHEKEKNSDGSPKYDIIFLDLPATGHGLSLFAVPDLISKSVPVGLMKNEADSMVKLTTDTERSAAIIVSIPEELVIEETFELYKGLMNSKVPVKAILINQISHFEKTDLLTAIKKGKNENINTDYQEFIKFIEKLEEKCAVDKEEIKPLDELPVDKFALKYFTGVPDSQKIYDEIEKIGSSSS